MNPHIVLAAALLLPGVAHADQPSPCVAEYQAEEVRIQREAAARAPAPGSDVRTQQLFMQSVHEKLQAAAERARRCEQARRPQPGSAAHEQARQREQQCTDAAHRQVQEMEKRTPPGRPMSLAEQQARRAEEDRIMQTRMDCLRRAR